MKRMFLMSKTSTSRFLHVWKDSIYQTLFTYTDERYRSLPHQYQPAYYIYKSTCNIVGICRIAFGRYSAIYRRVDWQVAPFLIVKCFEKPIFVKHKTLSYLVYSIFFLSPTSFKKKKFNFIESWRKIQQNCIIRFSIYISPYSHKTPRKFKFLNL